MTIHLTCVHIIFNSVSVAERPPFWEIAAHSVDHMFSLYFNNLLYTQQKKFCTSRCSGKFCLDQEWLH